MFSKLAWIIPIKGKTSTTLTIAFQKMLGESTRKPDKIWIDQGRKVDNRSMKLWLEQNAIEWYSKHDERKCVAAKYLLEPERISFINIWLQY